MTKLPISVCMISGAEARRISRALDSVAGWTSEVIVVLNEEVTDATEEIARSRGAQVFREPWKGHVAQKNSAAQKAGQPWILGLDTDEAVSPELREEIQRAFAAGVEDGTAAFSVPRVTQYYGRWIRHGEWYPDRGARLWRRGQAAWGGVDPHDKLEVRGGVRKLRGDLLHYSMEGIDGQLRKIIRYADDFARGCKAGGRRVGFVDLAIRPPWRFVRGYVLKLGFLDGWQGFSIAWMTAFYTFFRYFKALESQAEAGAPGHPGRRE
ncbi:MAG: glycosyltransferase family 2 protein [Verrucomicrobiota bacterium]